MSNEVTETERDVYAAHANIFPIAFRFTSTGKKIRRIRNIHRRKINNNNKINKYKKIVCF